MTLTAEMYTVVKMMESLPQATQKRVVNHLRVYLAEIDDEAEWDALFQETQPQLIAEARRVRQEIEEGIVEPMDYDRL
jgi:hypothetical protein